MDIQERNRLANIYRKEAQRHGIASPYRQNEYINARLKGKNDQKSLKIAKKGVKNA